MDWTSEKVDQARREIFDLLTLVRGVQGTSPHPEVVAALSDDLNTPQAMYELRNLRNGVAHGREDPAVLRASLDLLGVISVHPSVGSSAWGSFSEHEHEVAMKVARKWFGLRVNKRFEEADELRDLAAAAGLVLEAIKVVQGQQPVARLQPNFDAEAAEGLFK